MRHRKADFKEPKRILTPISKNLEYICQEAKAQHQNKKYFLRENEEYIRKLVWDISATPTAVTGGELSKLLMALSYLGFGWEGREWETLQKLLTLIQAQLDRLKIPYVFSALARLGFSVQDEKCFPRPLRDGLLQALRGQASSFTMIETTMTLNALAKLGFSGSDISTQIIIALDDHVIAFDSQGIANTLWALATMGLTWREILAALRGKLWAAIDRNIDHFNPQEIANALWALTTMGLTWREISAALRGKLWAAIDHNAGHFNPQEIANALWALATMGLTWQEISAALRGKLWAAIDHNAGHFNPQEIANALWALATMGLTWQEISAALRGKLWAAIDHNAGHFNPQE